MQTNDMIRALQLQFYMEMFPQRSKFEKPVERYNLSLIHSIKNQKYISNVCIFLMKSALQVKR